MRREEKNSRHNNRVSLVIRKVRVPGQSTSLQIFISVFSPSQVFPPLISRCWIDRWRCVEPSPQVLEQSIQSAQSVQAQSTKSNTHFITLRILKHFVYNKSEWVPEMETNYENPKKGQEYESLKTKVACMWWHLKWPHMVLCMVTLFC